MPFVVPSRSVNCQNTQGAELGGLEIKNDALLLPRIPLTPSSTPTRWT